MSAIVDDTDGFNLQCDYMDKWLRAGFHILKAIHLDGPLSDEETRPSSVVQAIQHYTNDAVDENSLIDMNDLLLMLSTGQEDTAIDAPVALDESFFDVNSGSFHPNSLTSSGAADFDISDVARTP
ncbi:hypothetical protein BASA62_007251 [Batrachochytrium salamandrivorans]|nr:hypothetical protein BASA62_007251 [Batrachochytrium salamandrivorans]